MGNLNRFISIQQDAFEADIPRIRMRRKSSRKVSCSLLSSLSPHNFSFVLQKTRFKPELRFKSILTELLPISGPLFLLID
jgi:hypothetical protein